MQSSKNRLAMTLMELLVVVSILALLAMLAIPKLVDVYERSRSGVQAYSLTDAARMIEIHYAVNKKYPDGFDSLMASPGGATIYPNLHSALANGTFFTTATLDAIQLSSLQNAGLGHAFLHDTTAGVIPSDSGTDRRHFGTGSGHDGTANINQLLVVNEAPGSDGFNLLVNEFNVVTNTTAGNEASSAALIDYQYVVLGFGPRNTAVINTIQAAPIFEAADPTRNYSRGLAIFQVHNTSGAKARLVGMLGPDGRALKFSLQDYQTGVVPH